MKLSIVSLFWLFVLPVVAEEAGGRKLALDTTACQENVNCCVGHYSCSGSGENGAATVKTGSCSGRQACQNVAYESTGTFAAGENSCKGDYSCQSAARNGGAVIAEDSCVGRQACQNGGYDQPGSLSTEKDSCKGSYACLDAGRNGTTTVESTSCHGEWSCSRAGKNGKAVIEAGACNGQNACQNTGSDTTGTFTAESNSCQGGWSCVEAGRAGAATVGPGSCVCSGSDRYACHSAGRKGKFTVAESSCTGASACHNSAANGGESIIEKNTCVGQSACQTSAYDPTGRFKAEEGSCKGPWACSEAGRAGSATISPGSCIADDPNDNNAKHACNSAGKGGNFTVAESSCLGGFACHGASGKGGKSDIQKDACIGQSSCQYISYDTGNSLIKEGSCKGPGACYEIGRTGSATISPGSCIAEGANDKHACASAGRDGNFNVAESSCIGANACQGSARGVNGTSVIQERSCIGKAACQNSAYDTGVALINDDSCKGPWACSEIGRYGSATVSPGACIASDPNDANVKSACSSAGRKGTFTVAESGCLGPFACSGSAGNGGKSVVTKNACIGRSACQNSAYDPDSKFFPQEDSCKGPWACSDAGRGGSATIGTGSCIASDPNDANIKNACSSVGRKEGNFTVAESGCLGALACHNSAGNGGESVVQKDACIGQSACQNSAYDPDSKFFPQEDSCKGPWACSDAGRGGSATIGTGSCIAEDPNDANIKHACSSVGRKEGNFTVAESGCLGALACHNSAGNGGESVVQKDACIGRSACQTTAYDPSGSFSAEEGSCKGNRACSDMGRTGSATVKVNACNGDSSCTSAGNKGKAVINDSACIGNNSCQNSGYDRSGSFSAEEGSCKGPWACSDAGRIGSATVGKGSCIAEDPNDAGVKFACLSVARDGGNFTVAENSCTETTSCINSGRKGSSVIGSNSCNGVRSCENCGYKGSFTIADSACDGKQSCSNVAYEVGSFFKAGKESCVSAADEEMSCERAANRGGNVDIGERSCIGKYTCRHIAYNKGTVKIGDDSCLGLQACYQIANAGGDVEIGDGSCQHPSSCRAIGRYAVEHDSITKERGRLEIGNGSCNCVGCCGCLKAGDKVPDGTCNSFGNGPEHCCTAEGDRNPFGPLKVSNLCLEEQDKCLKATVSGDPHLTTFSGTRFDCMGQGEFILAKSQNVSDPLEIRGLFVDPEFEGEQDPWENNKSAQTTTRGVAFVVDEDIPMIRIMTDQEKGLATCNLYFYLEGVGNVTMDRVLNDQTLFKREDLAVTGRTNWVNFKFGDYDADILVRVHNTPRWGCMMSLAACLKPKYHGDVLGLFGTNNPWKDDDWTTPDGTRLTIPSDTRSSGFRGLATSYCLDNWCHEGVGGDPSVGSFFSDYHSKYYSRCDKSPYNHYYNETKVDEMLDKIRLNCDASGLFNIPQDVLYDAAVANHIRDPQDTECPLQDILDAETNNAIAAFNCEVAPTPSPSAQPSYISDASPTVINGDPHFKTWMGEHFEYHGQCDLVMLKDSSFADGLGLQIQIRTKLVRYWSYIRSVAILIGDDILEIEGSADFATDGELFYWYNLEEKGEMKTVGGFPISTHRRSKIKQRFAIDLSSKYPGESIEVHTFKEFVKVEYVNGSEESVGNTVGMMGDYKTGKTLGRDGSVFNDFTEFGIEWQVRPEDQMLFHDVSHPQFPKTCVLPEDPQGQRRRRLDESSIKEAEAEKACASLKDPLDRKDCVYDVLATQDLEMVGAF